MDGILGQDDAKGARQTDDRRDDEDNGVDHQ
jgi:hypothetical protein